ncbi:hypothetical protein J7E97_07060 [Streptomyces sp. ISL-66]|uniref:hypothetical protein n=1 Tax=Streptomyces sp. ISL-66 TaxID=2819186 RepID=UPI001BED06CB|nr:hypothetical protein [Streptomyces sp. ISL-66]MBT2467632.1 hypothetical protein [Streptomyces sp. ISL-66]
MSAAGAVAPGARTPRPSAVSMGALLAAGAAASAVSTPPSRERARRPDPGADAVEGEGAPDEAAAEAAEAGEEGRDGEGAAPESEAA